MNIELVDLKNQYKKIKSEVDESIMDILSNATFINGPKVKSFTANLAKYLNVKHVIPVANGTDALQIALMALDLKPGDEVITPSFTYIATAEVIALLKLKPVFVDVELDTFTINCNSLKRMISDKTKAIIPVHLYGQCANMEDIMAIAQKNNLKVVEDTAQAIGSDYTFSNGEKSKAGTIGDIGCTSFFPSKNLGCYGDGGAIFTNNDDLAAKIKMIANHGQSKRYYHDVIGVNSRLDSIQAAVLDVKLKHLDSYCQERQKVAKFYNELFKPFSDLIETPSEASFSTHVYHQYTIKLKGIDREEFQNALSAKKVPSNIYYPLPIHLQKGFLNLDRRLDNLENTEKLMKSVLSLPIHTEMDDEQLNYIKEAIVSYLKTQKSLVK